MTAEDSLESTAAGLAPRVRELAEETERGRRLPRELVEAFARGGIFRMLVPRRFGGGEAGVATMIATLEALSRADGSAGWCAMIGATSGVVAAYLPESDAREIYGTDPHVEIGRASCREGEQY